jgi:hypothetical protein
MKTIQVRLDLVSDSWADKVFESRLRLGQGFKNRKVLLKRVASSIADLGYIAQAAQAHRFSTGGTLWEHCLADINLDKIQKLLTNFSEYALVYRPKGIPSAYSDHACIELVKNSTEQTTMIVIWEGDKGFEEIKSLIK